jgi:WD40 repeat protein
MVWELASSGTTKLFGSDEEIHETWRAVVTLRGHNGGFAANSSFISNELLDVIDLSWSPDFTKIVSASLDNTLIVWDVLKASKMIK